MEIDRARQLIREHSPLAADEIELLGAGTDRAAFRVDGEWVVRFPLVRDAQGTLATERARVGAEEAQRERDTLAASATRTPAESVRRTMCLARIAAFPFPRIRVIFALVRHAAAPKITRPRRRLPVRS
jgi:hypothetical protein